MNLLLHGVEDFKIVREDTLRNPAFYTGNRLAQFDCVDRQSAVLAEELGRGPSGRPTSGAATVSAACRPKEYADWAWVQHMITSMRAQDAAASPSSCPRARCSGRAPKAKIRDAHPQVRRGRGRDRPGAEPVLRHRPRRLRPRSCDRRSRPSAKGKVLFINGEQLFKRGRNQNTLEPEHAEQLLDAYEPFERHRRPRPRRRRSTRSRGNDYNLNIPLYVAPADTGEKLTLAEALAELEARARRRPRETRAALEAELAKWGLGVPHEQTRITQRELESYLWGAAIVLRGLIDAGDYKQYIFPLLFLKRISDVYDEEHAAALEIYGDEELADLAGEPPLRDPRRLPLGRHPRGHRRTSAPRSCKAMRAIESANPDTPPRRLRRRATGRNKNRLPDSHAQRPDRALLDARRSRSRTCPRTSSATATST